MSLHQQLLEYPLEIPEIFKNLKNLSFSPCAESVLPPSIAEHFPHLNKINQKPIRAHSGKAAEVRPLKIGVVFSGGPASGGHNVILGLLEALKALHPQSELIGFLNGPDGILRNQAISLTPDLVRKYKNQGGFDLIGSGRTKIEKPEQMAQSLRAAKAQDLNGLVIIGGDDSNTNAAILAEYFLAQNAPISVVGVPKTIDGDLRNEYVPISFGFDTAAKVYSEMIGNIARDAQSSRKYTHFIKLMGRSASHIALECALHTQPNAVLISEEIAQEQMTLRTITSQLADTIAERARTGKNYGIVLIPEGLIEFIPEMGALIKELNALLAQEKTENLPARLTAKSRECWDSLPEKIHKQLLLERDPHGNVNVSHIETESLLIELVEQELKRRAQAGTFQGKFSPLAHFFGYEGRSGYPSLFDAHYCYALGMTAALLLNHGATGIMAFVDQLEKSVAQWSAGGTPLAPMLHLEQRKGALKPAIQKALVDLKGRPFQFLKQHRSQWALEDSYRFPGPIQFFGIKELCFSIPLSTF